MKTLRELEILESIVFETGLRGEAAEAEFQKVMGAAKPTTLFRRGHNMPREYSQWVHDEINGSIEFRQSGNPLLPDWEIWAGKDMVEYFNWLDTIK